MLSQQINDPAAHLSIEDLAINSTTTPSVAKLTIKQSNTDPFHKEVARPLYLKKGSRHMSSPSHIAISSSERALTWSIVCISRWLISNMPSSLPHLY